MAFLGIVQCVIILTIAIYEFKLKSPSVFLWATLLIMFGIMHMLTCITGDHQYSKIVLNKASLFSVVFCLLYLLIRIPYGPRSNRKKTREVFCYETLQLRVIQEQSFDGLLFAILLAAMLLKLVPYILYVGDIFSSSWESGRDYSAGLGYVNSEQFARIIIYSFSGLTALLYIRKNKKWIAVAILILLEVLLTRNRIEILPLFCSLIMIYIIKKDKLDLKTICFVGIIGVFVIYTVYALRVFRHYGTIQEFIQTFDFKEFNDKILSYLATGNGELGLRRDFYFFIDGENNFKNFGKMHSYLRMFFVYLPTRWSFGLKPADFAITMGQAIGMSTGGSTHPTLFGDCFANAGYWGVCLGVFWGMYCNVIDGIIVRCRRASTQILMYGLNAVVYVIIARGSVYNGFWFAAYGVPFLLVMEWCIIHFRNHSICLIR